LLSPPQLPQIPPNSTLNFHNFLNFHQPKVHFFSQILKNSRILPYKKYFFSQKGTPVKKKKKSETPPHKTADTKKVEKIDFDFCQFFFAFLCRSRRGDHFF
jgi:hypothetical protein